MHTPSRIKSSRGPIYLTAVATLLLATSSAQIIGPDTVKTSLAPLEDESGVVDSSSLKAIIRSLHGVHLPAVNRTQGNAQRLTVAVGNKSTNSSLRFDVQYILDQLSAAGPFLACSWDPTLQSDLQALAGTKWLLAANFRDNAEMMPQFIRQTWLLASLLPPDSLFVSMYESGSKDGWTAQWLGVLSRLLSLIDVRHTIITDGDIKRADGENRIEFLAKVRNRVLEPLWSGGNATGGVAWPADRVIFSNDVYLCAKDFVRLMLHKADVVCGLDFGDRSKVKLPRDAAAADQGKGQQVFGSALAAVSRRLHEDPKALHIYDKWVLRDARGNMMDYYPPYTSTPDPYTLSRLEAGLPFPVTTCWNGMAVIPAQPFIRGLRFRSHMEGECRGSECSLLSHDLHRLGYRRAVVDPGVRLAYEHWDAVGLHLEAVVGNIGRTTWADVKKAPPIPDTHFYQDSEMCCNEDELDWLADPLPCHRASFLEPNYTAVAFPSRHARAAASPRHGRDTPHRRAQILL